MRQTYQNLITKLKEKLEGIKDENGKTILYQVFTYKGAEMTGYPTAVIMDTANEGSFLDTHRNQRVFSFQLLIYQEQSVAGKSKEIATQVMRKTVDIILESFDTDLTLNNELQFIRIVPVEIDYTIEQGSFVFATFRIDCVDIVNNF